MDTLLKFLSLDPRDALMIPVGTVLFFLLWKTLERKLFRPFLALIEAREAATSGAVETAQAKRVEAQEKSASYDRQLTEARISAMRGKLSALSAAKTEAAKIVEQAEGQAQQVLSEGRAAVTRDVQSLRAETLGSVDSLSQMIVERITQAGQGSKAAEH